MMNFKVGDHVVVTDDPYTDGVQIGCTGTVVEIIYVDHHTRVLIVYDFISPLYTDCRIGEENSYKESEITHSPLHLSPLLKALR
jgi:hypothetical protein